MIRKLRIQFFCLALLAVILVLLVLVGGINLLNYREVIKDSDNVLDILYQNGGSFPEHRMPDIPRGRFTEEIEFNEYTMGGSIFRRIDRIDSPELPYETRYFSAILSKDGKVIRTDTARIQAIDDESAAAYAAKALSTGKTKGFFGEYRFLTGEVLVAYEVNMQETGTEEGYLVIFCDCGASLGNFRNFLRTSVMASLACLVLVGVLIYLLSNRIIAPVAESYEKQKRFITDAGHEIKTPLAIISADVDVLEMELEDSSPATNSGDLLSPDDAEQSSNEWLSDIKLQTKRLSELTNDLILLSKMEEKETALEIEDLDMTKICTAAASSFRAVAVSSEKELTSEIDPDIHFQGDRKSIESLVSIILDNAVKYCPKGGKISAVLSRSRKNVVLEVTNDTEETPTAEMLKSMFERFYRSDKSRNSKTGGHGIGLSIAKAVVEKHKGRISATSRGEKQLTITITL